MFVVELISLGSISGYSEGNGCLGAGNHSQQAGEGIFLGFACQVSRIILILELNRYTVNSVYIFLLCLGPHHGCERNPTSVVSRSVDVRAGCYG